jgi:ferredoxin
MPMHYLKNVTTLEYDPAKCRGCEKCAEVCPHGVFVMDGDAKARLTDRDLCIECGACMRNCPFDAIKVRPGVGCAYAILFSALRGKPAPTCD